MPNTPNHNYNAPDEGATNWHVPLNENFENLDVDVEIRDSEANKGDYTPKEGAKYEATDSGGVYYGNGNSWVLADRTVRTLESDSFATGEYLKSGDSSTAIVAPSVASAFDGIQEAIDAEYSDVILAEEITEANITIPRSLDRFRLQGVGNGATQNINDPGGEPYVIGVEEGDTKNSNTAVHIKDINFERTGIDSGIAFKGGKNLDDPSKPNQGCSVCILENVTGNAGPVYMIGPRNILFNVHLSNWSTREFPVPAVSDPDQSGPYYDRHGLVVGGATNAIYGGTFSAKEASKTAAYIAAGSYTITGGTTFSNTRIHKEGTKTSHILFNHTSRGFVAGVSTEYAPDVDYDIQFGVEHEQGSAGGGCSNTFFAANSMFRSLNIENSSHNNIFHTFDDMSIRKVADARSVIYSHENVTIEDDPDTTKPEELSHIDFADYGAYRIGGGRDSPPTALGLQIHDAPPQNPQNASFVVADGVNWDPSGNGNATLVAYDTDGTWKPIFEYSGSL